MKYKKKEKKNDSVECIFVSFLFFVELRNLFWQKTKKKAELKTNIHFLEYFQSKKTAKINPLLLKQI